MPIANEVAAGGDVWVAVESMLEVLAGLHAISGVKHRQGEAGEAKRGDF